MATITGTLLFKQGVESGIPTLAEGEPGWCTDTHKLYVGNGVDNTLVGPGAASLDLTAVALQTPTTSSHVVGTNAANNANERYLVSALQALSGWVPPNDYSIVKNGSTNAVHERILENDDLLTDYIAYRATRRTASGGDVSTCLISALEAYARVSGADAPVASIELVKTGASTVQSGSFWFNVWDAGVKRTPMTFAQDGTIYITGPTAVPTGADASLLMYDAADGIARVTINENQIVVGNASNKPSLFNATAQGLALLDDATAANQRTTLGLGALATQNIVQSATQLDAMENDENTASFNITSNSFAATGITLTLTSGLYLVNVHLNGLINNNTLGASLVYKLRNTTDSTDVTDSETLIARNSVINVNTLAVSNRVFFINISATKTFEIYALRTAVGTYAAAPSSDIFNSATLGKSAISYVRLSNHL